MADTRAESAVDGCFRLVSWDAEPGRNVLEHRFDIAASKCLRRDEARQAERG